ncbi:MAG TPA: DUF4388 domain-containing protein [Thermodesulfovibrionales bacterium]|jgi:hypothetical protein|nr:DUF4388 domain-containing protein [Thermodesulfovibrionales bacterium]
MAFTGDLEQLHIVDVIQMVNTTRKSGTLSVSGSRGESRIFFSKGLIVGATHLNNRVRIGTVMVKMNAITAADLKEALEVQGRAGKDRKPLIATLIGLGKLRRDEAYRGLKKLIEIAVVELIGWTAGTFTLDTEAIAVSAECSYDVGRMEQEIGIDAQMILMDALRIFDERERDRKSGKAVMSDEELFADVLPPPETPGSIARPSHITAEDLGLGDLDRLERRIPESIAANEIFNPAGIHRQRMKELLADFSPDEQKTFASFLEKSTPRKRAYDGSQRTGRLTKGLILFSEDELIKHSVMTICKDEGVLVFATDSNEELNRIIDQCLAIKVLPLLVLDDPETSGGLLFREQIKSIRRGIRERYPWVSIVQMSASHDYSSLLRAFQNSIRAVFPKPSRETRAATFIPDTIAFLEAFKSYISTCFHEQEYPSVMDQDVGTFKDRILSLRNLHNPAAVSLALLQHISGICDRSVTFIVRSGELTGEKAIGVYGPRDEGPAPASVLKVPLSKPSVFRTAIEKGEIFYGESSCEILKDHLFAEIGRPLRPTILLVPVKSHGKTMTLTYGDFGLKEAVPVNTDLLELIANEAGLVMENTLYLKQLRKAAQK